MGRTAATLRRGGGRVTHHASGCGVPCAGYASFPTPTPTLAALTQAINDLQTAENAVLARTKGAAATRNEKRIALDMLLQQLKGLLPLRRS